MSRSAHNCYNDLVHEFQSAMADLGLTCNDVLIPDGEIHRFHVEGDRSNSKNVWYVINPDSAIHAGAFGSWKTSQSEKWRMKSRDMLTSAERQAWSKQMKEAKAKRKADQVRINAEAREKAVDVWQTATTEPSSHPYIKNKQIIPIGIKQRGENLVIPLLDSDAVLHSIQFIDHEGNKRLLSGGKVTGHYCAIGSIKDSLYICEGYATGVSIHLHVDKDAAVAVAFNTGNLKPVEQLLHDKYPNVQIIIAADNDSFTEGNPGLTKAKEAAASIGAKMIWPNFDGLNSTGTDFNDYVLAGGLK